MTRVHRAFLLAFAAGLVVAFLLVMIVRSAGDSGAVTQTPTTTTTEPKATSYCVGDDRVFQTRTGVAVSTGACKSQMEKMLEMDDK